MIQKKKHNLPKGTWAICEEELKLIQSEKKESHEKDNFDSQWPMGLSLPKKKECDKKE